LKEKVISLILKIKDQNIKVKNIQSYDSGEIKYLEDECKSKGLDIVFEYTGPRTPQRNGRWNGCSKLFMAEFKPC
jgi:hypothetical protein